MVAHVSRRTLAIEDTKDMANLLEKPADEIGHVFNDLQLLLSRFREELKGMPADAQSSLEGLLEELKAVGAELPE
jgi:hypothetical protein